MLKSNKKKKTHKLVTRPQYNNKKLIKEKNKSFFFELLKLHAYYGDTSLRNHYSQDSFIIAYRNDYSLYNLHSSIINIKRALYFLQKQKNKSLIFVGNPKDAKTKCEILFQTKNIPFFPSSEWVPGFISKTHTSMSKVLIIYDLFTNHGAKSEALKANCPIVGFFTIHADVSGVDFPINLNFEHCGMWYYSLWKTFLQANILNDTRSK